MKAIRLYALLGEAIRARGPGLEVKLDTNPLDLVDIAEAGMDMEEEVFVLWSAEAGEVIEDDEPHLATNTADELEIIQVRLAQIRHEFAPHLRVVGG
jgi:hypothetical protein